MLFIENKCTNIQAQELEKDQIVQRPKFFLNILKYIRRLKKKKAKIVGLRLKQLPKSKRNFANYKVKELDKKGNH